MTHLERIYKKKFSETQKKTLGGFIDGLFGVFLRPTLDGTVWNGTERNGIDKVIIIVYCRSQTTSTNTLMWRREARRTLSAWEPPSSFSTRSTRTWTKLLPGNIWTITFSVCLSQFLNLLLYLYLHLPISLLQPKTSLIILNEEYEDLDEIIAR